MNVKGSIDFFSVNSFLKSELPLAPLCIVKNPFKLPAKTVTSQFHPAPCSRVVAYLPVPIHPHVASDKRNKPQTWASG